MLKKVMRLFEDNRDEEAYALASKCGFDVYEIWENDTIIGVQVEDDIVYFEGV